jgi:hypothetical protein
MGQDDFLPDSRTREVKGSIRSPYGNLIPVYCAQCGKEHGLVPEQHLTFAFCLCDPCAEKMGPIAHFYKEPDEVFWERINNAMQEEQRKTRQAMTPQSLALKLEDPSSIFAKLAEEWKKHAIK